MRLAVVRKLWQEAMQESRRISVPRGRSQGIYTDEEVFRLIS
jgi:hypothetical protein